MTFDTNKNGTLLSATIQLRWIQIVIDPNGGSPITNFKGTLFNRNSPGNKTEITLAKTGIWTILAGTDEQQTCAIIFEKATSNLFTYIFDQAAGTATQFANITVNYMAQASKQPITQFGVADNCQAIKFNGKVWHYDNSLKTYVQDVMPEGNTGFVTLDEPYRTAIIGGSIY